MPSMVSSIRKAKKKKKKNRRASPRKMLTAPMEQHTQPPLLHPDDLFLERENNRLLDANTQIIMELM